MTSWDAGEMNLGEEMIADEPDVPELEDKVFGK